MKYGIHITKQIFDIYEDGSAQLTSTSTGWLDSHEYDMKKAKDRLETTKVALNEEYYTIKVVNSRTIKGEREAHYNGEQFAPIKVKAIVTLHIEKK